MIPLLHIITFANSFFAFSLAFKIFSSYRKTKNTNLRNFFIAFLALGIYFGLTSLPALISNPVVIQIIYIISYLPLYLTILFIVLVLLNLFRFGLSYFIISLLFLSIVIIPILNIINFAPASVSQFGSLFYWSEGTPPWLQTIHSALGGLAALATTILFLIGGIKTKEKMVRYRAFLISLGMFIFIIFGVSNFILAVYFQEIFYKFLTTTIGGILSFISIGLIFWGTNYSPKET